MSGEALRGAETGLAYVDVARATGGSEWSLCVSPPIGFFGSFGNESVALHLPLEGPALASSIALTLDGEPIAHGSEGRSWHWASSGSAEGAVVIIGDPPQCSGHVYALRHRTWRRVE